MSERHEPGHDEPGDEGDWAGTDDADGAWDDSFGNAPAEAQYDGWQDDSWPDPHGPGGDEEPPRELASWVEGLSDSGKRLLFAVVAAVAVLLSVVVFIRQPAEGDVAQAVPAPTTTVTGTPAPTRPTAAVNTAPATPSSPVPASSSPGASPPAEEDDDHGTDGDIEHDPERVDFTEADDVEAGDAALRAATIWATVDPAETEAQWAAKAARELDPRAEPPSRSKANVPVGSTVTATLNYIEYLDGDARRVGYVVSFQRSVVEPVRDGVRRTTRYNTEYDVQVIRTAQGWKVASVTELLNATS